MKQPYRGISLVAALAIVGVLLGAAPAAAEPGTCAVTAGTSGGKKYATLKCAKKSSPGHFVIRSTVWQHEDNKEYQNLARLAGHSFSCTLRRSKSVKRARIRKIYYELSNCN